MGESEVGEADWGRRRRSRNTEYNSYLICPHLELVLLIEGHSSLGDWRIRLLCLLLLLRLLSSARSRSTEGQGERAVREEEGK